MLKVQYATKLNKTVYSFALILPLLSFSELGSFRLLKVVL
jgi:hypothetical protein